MDTDSYSILVNPIAATETSVQKGERLFEQFCSSCHGNQAKGGGPMAEYYGEPPPLDDESNLEIPDGFFYSSIRHGRGMMPALGEALSPEERWHIVNYVRRLQRK